jgi:rod shape-determining protein MreC
LVRNNNEDVNNTGRIRRLFLGVLVVFCLVLFLLWRIDNSRAENIRLAILDKFVPNVSFLISPFTVLQNIFLDFRSYSEIFQMNQDLTKEIQKLKYWKEQAIQWEAKYAKLLDLNNVKLDSKLIYFSAMVLADSGSGFRQNILINVGSKDGVKNGWATTDGLGLVGRITGVGKETSLVMLLTDTSSKIAVSIQPSGEKAIVQGDNTRFPTLELIENDDLVKVGDRIFTSGDGEVFPKGLLIGRVVRDSNGRGRVNLAADYKRLTFLKVMRMAPVESVIESDSVIGENETEDKEKSDD